MFEGSDPVSRDPRPKLVPVAVLPKKYTICNGSGTRRKRVCQTQLNKVTCDPQQTCLLLIKMKHISGKPNQEAVNSSKLFQEKACAAKLSTPKNYLFSDR